MIAGPYLSEYVWTINHIIDTDDLDSMSLCEKLIGETLNILPLDTVRKASECEHISRVMRVELKKEIERRFR